jgi:GNAT superfamily N-acetyltransferase
MAGLERVVDLRLPPEIEYSTLASVVAGDAAIRAELDLSQRTQISDAARFAFELIVSNAANEEQVPVRLQFFRTSAEFHVTLLDHELALDDERVRRDPRWLEILDRVDRAHWTLRARCGSELHLAMRRAHGAHQFVKPPAQDGVPLAPSQEYTTRRFRPEDGAGVGRAFYQVYGYNYVFPAVYVPRRLIELNKTDDYISIVAIAENGEVAGHVALDPFPGTPLADASGAVVAPAHRKRGLLERLHEFAEDEARQLGFAGYYQEDNTHSDALVCAIELGAHAISIKPLKRRERRVVYIPPQHREIIDLLYATLDLPIEHGQGLPTQEAGEVHVNVARALGRATITVSKPGTPNAQQIAQVVADIRRLARLGGICIDLPLEDPGTPALCTQLERLGFFFCGIIPWFLGGHDALRLQLPLRPVDRVSLPISGEFGERLKAYVHAQMFNRPAETRLNT